MDLSRRRSILLMEHTPKPISPGSGTRRHNHHPPQHTRCHSATQPGCQSQLNARAHLVSLGRCDKLPCTPRHGMNPMFFCGEKTSLLTTNSVAANCAEQNPAFNRHVESFERTTRALISSPPPRNGQGGARAGHGLHFGAGY